MLENRNGKQCRERWFNHLNPTLKHGPWTKEEDYQLIQCQSKLGNSWTKIATYLPGRSENDVKNRWYSASIKRQIHGGNIGRYNSHNDQSHSTSSSDDGEIKIHSKSIEYDMVKILLTDDELLSLKVGCDYIRSIAMNETKNLSVDTTRSIIHSNLIHRNNNITLLKSPQNKTPMTSSLSSSSFLEPPMKRKRNDFEMNMNLNFKNNSNQFSNNVNKTREWTDEDEIAVDAAPWGIFSLIQTAESDISPYPFNIVKDSKDISTHSTIDTFTLPSNENTPNVFTPLPTFTPISMTQPTSVVITTASMTSKMDNKVSNNNNSMNNNYTNNNNSMNNNYTNNNNNNSLIPMTTFEIGSDDMEIFTSNWSENGNEHEK